MVWSPVLVLLVAPPRVPASVLVMSPLPLMAPVKPDFTNSSPDFTIFGCSWHASN